MIIRDSAVCNSLQGVLLPAFVWIASIPTAAFGQTEACSFSNPLAEQCSDLDPNTCVATGGVPLGPGTACPISSGTVAGDLNGDSDLNLLDVDPFTLALIDPAGYAAAYPSGNINLADMDHDGFRSGLDVSVFVAALIGPPSPCKFGRKYCDVIKAATATGCSALIDTRDTTLCGEPTETKPATSSAWVGVTLYSGNPLKAVKWAQTGYGRDRSRTPPLSTTITFAIYAETMAGPLPNDYNYREGPPPYIGINKYNCHLV